MYGMMYGMRKTTVYLPDALKARLTRVAVEKRTSEAEIIREAIDNYTADRERRRPTAPLFAGGTVAPVEDFDEALRGFGER
jgi:metal-responsive CopG/Arc/MetJ family transcriptional regulator